MVNKVSDRHCISPSSPFVPRDSESAPLHVCDYEPVVHLASFPGIVYNKKKKKTREPRFNSIMKNEVKRWVGSGGRMQMLFLRG